MLVPEEATSCAPCRYSATRCCAGAASSESRDKAALQPQEMVVMAFDCHKPQAAHGILVCQVARCLQVLCLLALHSASAQLQHHLSWRLMHTAHLSAACMTLASPEQEHLCIHCPQTAVVLLQGRPSLLKPARQAMASTLATVVAGETSCRSAPVVFIQCLQQHKGCPRLHQA